MTTSEVAVAAFACGVGGSEWGGGTLTRSPRGGGGGRCAGDRVRTGETDGWGRRGMRLPIPFWIGLRWSAGRLSSETSPRPGHSRALFP